MCRDNGTDDDDVLCLVVAVVVDAIIIHLHEVTVP